MQARVGDLYIHKDLGDIYLVTQACWLNPVLLVECINLDKGRTCSINSIEWNVFYKPLVSETQKKV